MVAEAFGFKVEDLSGRRVDVRSAKKVAVELCCRYSNLSDRKVGECFGYRSNGAVMKQRVRLKKLVASDKKLERKIKRIESQLSDF